MVPRTILLVVLQRKLVHNGFYHQVNFYSVCQGILAVTNKNIYGRFYGTLITINWKALIGLLREADRRSQQKRNPGPGSGAGFVCIYFYTHSNAEILQVVVYQ